MERADVVVIGGGVSGLGFAWQAAQAGRQVLVLEREPRVGGCLASVRLPSGYWFELGAHTCYNSYGSLIDILEGANATDRLLERGPARARFGLLRDGRYRWLSPPKVLLQLNWLEAAVNAPRGLLTKKAGRTIQEYYSRLLGKGNYRKVLGPFFGAVPSQSADAFPVEGPGSLFKKRERREAYLKSFSLEGGLQSAVEAAASHPNVTVESGVAVTRVARAEGGLRVELEGRTLEAPVVAVATPVSVAAELLREDFGRLAETLGRVGTVRVESVGAAVAREKAWMPEAAFVVPVDDVFHSVVTRDPVPDERRRAFTFHFKPGLSRDEKLARMTEVLKVEEGDLEGLAERETVLPSPVLGHGETVAAIDAALAGERLALVGNYFAGLAIEDCLVRSRAEWARVAGAAEPVG